MHSGPSAFSLVLKETDICLKGDTTHLKTSKIQQKEKCNFTFTSFVNPSKLAALGFLTKISLEISTATLFSFQTLSHRAL